MNRAAVVAIACASLAACNTVADTPRMTTTVATDYVSLSQCFYLAADAKHPAEIRIVDLTAEHAARVSWEIPSYRYWEVRFTKAGDGSLVEARTFATLYSPEFFLREIRPLLDACTPEAR